VIISVSPFTLLFLAGALKREFPHIKVVIDTGDPFHGDSSSYSRRLLHRLFARRIEKAGLAKADIVIVPSLILKKHYLSCYGDVADERRVKVIENGISELFTTIPSARSERSAPFRMVYAGRFYSRMRDPSGLYAAVREFGPGEILLKLFGNIQEEYLPPASDTRFMTGGAVSAERLAREYEEADLVVYLDNAWGVQVPGKVYEVLAVNRPLLYICHDEASPSREIVSGKDGVFTVTNDQQSIAGGITRVMNETPEVKYLRGSELFTFDSLASRYGALLEGLISGDQADRQTR
jgi:glycosyltransferase involved in cell wall biosynthesis